MKNRICYFVIWCFTMLPLGAGAQAIKNGAKETLELANKVQQQILQCSHKADLIDQQIVDREIIFLRFNNENMNRLLQSKAILNDGQIKVLNTFRLAINRCRSLSSQFPLPSMVEIYQKYYQQVDQIYDDLLEKKITIGEANQKKMKLLEETFIKWHAIEESTRKSNATQ
jgi:predicted RNase H-like nuclease